MWWGGDWVFGLVMGCGLPFKNVGFLLTAVSSSGWALRMRTAEELGTQSFPVLLALLRLLDDVLLVPALRALQAMHMKGRLYHPNPG